MTKIVLPQMVERRCGAIVNISAGAAIHPNPQLSVYTASKVKTISRTNLTPLSSDFDTINRN